jgi:hypothetical protein
MLQENKLGKIGIMGFCLHKCNRRFLYWLNDADSILVEFLTFGKGICLLQTLKLETAR